MDILIDDLVPNWIEDIFRLDARNHDEWQSLDRQLAAAQYGYIKFGLMLEKIASNRLYRYCDRKFANFKQWCQSRVQISAWQAKTYIDAARVSIYLFECGLPIPRNYSQASALAPLYKLALINPHLQSGESELVRMWQEITQNNAPHEITAAKIMDAINPDRVRKSSISLKPGTIAEIKARAAELGLTIDEYLDRLMNGENYDELPADDTISEEQLATLNNLDEQYKQFARSRDLNQCGRGTGDRDCINVTDRTQRGRRVQRNATSLSSS